MPRDANGLTPKQARFVQEYLIDLNATQAAIRSGFSAKTARAAGARLLTHVDIRAAIEAQGAKNGEAVGVTAQRVLQELAYIAFSDMREFTEWGPTGVTLKAAATMSEASARCVAEVSETTSEKGGSIRFKLHGKVEALTLLGKHLGLFPERIAVIDPEQMGETELEKMAQQARGKLRLMA